MRALFLVPAVAVASCTCSPPTTGERCGNAIDDDGDGFIDCADPQCFDDSACFASCADLCTPGDAICDPAGPRTCGREAGAACLSYLAPVPCDAGLCSGGACVPPPCEDRCSVGQTLCSGTGAWLACQRLATGCFDWAALSLCEAGQTCSAGGCVSADGGCSNQCVAGDRRCTLQGFEQRCLAAANGCTEWSMPAARCGIDAGTSDAGAFTVVSACPLQPYTPVCGGAGGGSFSPVALTPPRGGLVHPLWAPRDGGAPFAGSDGTITRLRGSTLVPELDGGYRAVSQFVGEHENDLWALTTSSGDITRVFHRTAAGWTQVVHSATVTGVSLAVAGSEVWVLGRGDVYALVDGGLLPSALPPGTLAEFMVADPSGELWISGNAMPCSGLDGGEYCPRVVRGRPGAWVVEDFTCLPRHAGGQLWRRGANDMVMIGSESVPGGGFAGFLTHRLDAGWTAVERTNGWSPARIDGENGSGWVLAFGRSNLKFTSGAARYDGCLGGVDWLCLSDNAFDSNNCIAWSLTATSAGSWVGGDAWRDGGSQSRLWRAP